MKRLLIVVLLLAPALRAEDEDSGRLTVIRAGRVITVSGETFSPGVVIVEGDSIRAVGSNLDYDASARVIDARRETVMPGLVLARSRQSLPNYSRGALKAGFTAAEEIIASELDIEPLIRAGFTTIGFAPDGTSLPGSASAYRSASGAPELVEEHAYLRITMTSPARDRTQLVSAIRKAREAIEKREKAREEWEKKRREAEAKETQAKEKPAEKPPEKKDTSGGAAEEKPEASKPAEKPKAREKFEAPKIDPHLQPFVAILDGKPRDKAPALVELSTASDFRYLEMALEGTPEIAPNFLLETGRTSDFHLVVEALGESKPVVVMRPRLHYRPYTSQRYSLAAELVNAGCELAFMPSDSETTLRTYRVEVAELVRVGLRRETALNALTSAPAKVLGLADRVGSIEKGKIADIVFLAGDPLHPDSEVTRVMAAGELIWRRDKK